MKVELGAGARPAPGFLALDINPRTADVIADAMHLPFRSESIEEIRAVDVLEHLSYRDSDATLTEWARVIVPGGKLYVQVPDADAAILMYTRNPNDCSRRLPSSKGAIHWLEWVLLGGHRDNKYAGDDDDWRWNAHYSLWSAHALADALGAAGFCVGSMVTNDHPNLLCNATKAA